ncbi:hypothetical protein Tco_1296069, partial [Tanacetum coccineum]
CDFPSIHTAPFWKFPEFFLCFVGISRYFEFDDYVYPVFLTDDDEEMDLFVFINHADPTKDAGNQNDNVQDVGHDVNEEGAAAGQENPIEASIVCIEDEVPATVVEKAKGVVASTGGKSIAALQGLLERSTFPIEVGVTAADTLPFITSSVSLTPEHEGDGHTNSAIGPDLRTQHLAERFVVLLDSPCHSSLNVADVEVYSVTRSLVLDPSIMTTAFATTVVDDISSVSVPRVGDELVYASIFMDFTSTGTVGPDITGPSRPVRTELSSDTFYVSQDMDFKTLQQIYVPKWDVVNDYALDDVEVYRSMVDQLAPHRFFSQLCAMDYEQLFAEFNVGAARQTCLSAKLSLKETEAAEAIRLSGQVSIVEATEAARVAELNDLKERTTALEGHVAALESAIVIKDTELVSSNAQITKVSDYELFKEQYEAVQNEQVKILSDKVAGIDADLIGMALHLDEKFYPRFLTTTAGRGWILSRGLRLVVMKWLQSPEYLATLGRAIGRAIDKGMQDGLAAVIDHGKADEDQVVIRETSLSFSLDMVHARVQRIRGDVVSRRLSLSDAMVPLIEPLSAENLVGQASTSRVPATATTTALSTTFVQTSFVPLILVADYEVLGAGPSTKVPSPPKIVFEKEELETTPEHTTTP